MLCGPPAPAHMPPSLTLPGSMGIKRRPWPETARARGSAHSPLPQLLTSHPTAQANGGRCSSHWSISVEQCLPQVPIPSFPPFTLLELRLRHLPPPNLNTRTSHFGHGTGWAGRGSAAMHELELFAARDRKCDWQAPETFPYAGSIGSHLRRFFWLVLFASSSTFRWYEPVCLKGRRTS
jgi:hypothetical protein